VAVVVAAVMLPTVVPPVLAGVVVDALVVAVAVGIVGVEAVGVLMCGHSVSLQSGRNGGWNAGRKLGKRAQQSVCGFEYLGWVVP
jgi:hypothetical protein